MMIEQSTVHEFREDKEAIRQKLERQIDDFFSAGGSVDFVPIIIGEPEKKLSREEQVNERKHKDWARRAAAK